MNKGTSRILEETSELDILDRKKGRLLSYTVPFAGGVEAFGVGGFLFLKK